jgi:hypothetical protein
MTLRTISRSVSALLWLLCFALLALPLRAAPHLAYIYPAGGQRGTTVSLEVHGSDLASLAGFYTTGTGLTAKITPGKDAASRVVEIAIAKDAPLGNQQVRVYDNNGLSNPRYFCVGALPEMMEKEPNNTQKDAPHVTLPITINGRIQDNSDVDGATFHAKAGETIVCEVQALRILGQVGDSWLKGYMEIRDADGNTLAESEGTSDDYYRWDPLIAFTPPKEGDYTVFYRDLNWRGEPMAVYRLTLGVLPHALGIFPIGGKRGKRVTVHFSGPNLQDATQQVDVPAASPNEIEVAWSGPNGTTNARPFAVSDLPDEMQRAPNQTRETAQTVPFPCVVNGRLEKEGVHDYYRFHIDKKRAVALDLWSRRVGTPLDSELVLYNSKGDIMRTDDDSRGRDSRIEVELETGDYTIRVRDVDDRGGLAFPYRLVLAETQPILRVRALPDAPKIARGGTVKLDIHIDREDGMGGEVTVAAESLPPGITATAVTIPKDKQDGQITLTAAATAQPGPVRLEIIGTGKAGTKILKVVARTEETYNIQGTAYQRELIGPILLITEK